MSLSFQLADQPEQELTPAQVLGIALEFHHSGQLEKAREIYLRLVAEDPLHHIALHHLGLVAHQTGDNNSAVNFIRQATVAKPDYVEAFSNLTAILRLARRPKEAIDAGLKAIEIDPDYAQAHSNLGNAYEDLEELENALAHYRKAISLDPNFVEAQTNAANMLLRLGDRDAALAACEAIILRRPDAPDPYFYLGNILRDLCRPNDAIRAYQNALALRPKFADVYCNLGNILLKQTKLDEAVEAYRQAIAIKPEMTEAHCNLGAVLESQGKVAESIAAYKAALALDPNLFSARLELHHQHRYACDWTGIEQEESQLIKLLSRHDKPVPPFSLLSMHVSAAEHLRTSQIWAKCFEPYKVLRFDHAQRPRAKDASQRIKVGYLSGDFHRHATAHLMVELFERHDRDRFEFIAYSHGFDDQSEMRWRLRKAFDRFVDIKDLTSTEAAQVIFDDQIDILVELKGYTQHARNEIAAMRPAPVQVSYIGYPGTMGTDFIDYIIADPFVLPLDQQPFYSESIVHLPHCYQPNDTRRRIADHTPSRKACDLPEEGFVFCCFNNPYKITPQIFAIWMRLLKALPNAVLWLLDGNPLVKDNLRGEATKHGIDPDRLVFAPKLPSAEHLARHRVADLFLDTLPYNAHTTASDALWAGLPVVTCAGETFAGRVAGSLLQSVGLPELVTNSLRDYEALALRLAHEPKVLFALRQKLLAHKLTAPLFDIAQTTHDLERAYLRMWDIWTSGGKPEPFAIDAAVDANGQPMLLKAAQCISRVVYESCPLCGGLDIPQILGADCTKHSRFRPGLPETMIWRQCSACEHVFSEGYFADEDATKIFGEADRSQMVGHDMERLRPISGRIVGRIGSHVSSGDWLDVGFGNGSLLFTAEEWGFRPVGIDGRKDNVQALINLGYEAHGMKLEAMPDQGRFSVISMMNALPKMPFPKDALTAAHRLLREDGILFLSLPNMDTMVWRLLHANGINPYWGELESYHQFSRKRLYALLEEHGFRAIDYQVSEQSRVAMDVIAVKA